MLCPLYDGDGDVTSAPCPALKPIPHLLHARQDKAVSHTCTYSVHVRVHRTEQPRCKPIRNTCTYQDKQACVGPGRPMYSCPGTGLVSNAWQT